MSESKVDCEDCLPSSSTQAELSQPSTTTKIEESTTTTLQISKDNLINSSTFIPPSINISPRIVIEFCNSCRWIHRAIWTQTELFMTFPSTYPSGLSAITLVPCTTVETSGRFRVWLYLNRSIEQEFLDTAQSNGKKDLWDGAELVWDRKIEGGFPEMKELKQRIRNLMSPSQDLGHSDKGPHGRREAERKAEALAAKEVEETEKFTSLASQKMSALDLQKEEEEETKVDDYNPTFRC